MSKEDFSVVHLSTGHLGGAGLASRRLNARLNSAGVDSTFYALGRSDFTPGANEFSIARTLLNRFASALLTSIESRLSSKILFSPLSINSIPKGFADKFSDKQKTILHIHNWFNLLNFKEISRLYNLGFPIVITLHDQRTMTGGCHYSLGCHHFESDCSKCPLLKIGLNRIPNLVSKRSSRYIQNMDSGFAMIAPSNWMLSEAKKSYLLKNKKIIFIPNTLETTKKKILPGTKSDKSYITLGVASMSTLSYVKGGDLTKELEIECNDHDLPFKFLYMNEFPQDNEGRSEFWKKIDFLIVLSRAENSPNVIHEAKQLGIPVIASRIGGITELLDKNFDIGIGELELNTRDILAKLNSIPHSKRTNVDKELMQERFRQYTDGSIKEHIALYQKVSSESRNQ
jgi:glycosyltransferase involved in cell wall biosynthesis